jgi:hypothetical protein
MKKLALALALSALMATAADAYDVILKSPPHDGWLKLTVHFQNGKVQKYTYKQLGRLTENSSGKQFWGLHLPQYAAKDISKICYKPQQFQERCVTIKPSWTYTWFN